MIPNETIKHEIIELTKLHYQVTQQLEVLGRRLKKLEDNLTY